MNVFLIITYKFVFSFCIYCTDCIHNHTFSVTFLTADVLCSQVRCINVGAASVLRRWKKIGCSLHVFRINIQPLNFICFKCVCALRCASEQVCTTASYVNGMQPLINAISYTCAWPASSVIQQIKWLWGWQEGGSWLRLIFTFYMIWTSGQTMKRTSGLT